MQVDRKPDWLKVRHIPSDGMEVTRDLNRALGLRTVCDSAHCPNIGECWRTRSATYLILGERCSRRCRFCAVPNGETSVPDPDEARRLAIAVARSGLRYVVITSVTRDDLIDGGANLFAETIRAIREEAKGCTIEVLIPDLQGDPDALRTILEARPDVLGHNLEVVRRLQSSMRDPGASYDRSLRVLGQARSESPKMITKSSLMLGLGESEREVLESFQDLRREGVVILTMGQYLRPGPGQVPVHRYVPPEEFDMLRDKALGMGFRAVMAGPFVRSSYKANEAYQIARGE